MITLGEIKANGPDLAAARGDVAAAIQGADVVELIPLELCTPAPYNPRQFVAKPSPSLLQLALSIRRTGQVQPATVRRKGDGYEIVAGERRWRACRLRAKGEAEMVPADAWVGDAKQAAELVAAGAPFEHLRAVVRELTDEQAMEICAVENLEREDLAPLEEAAGVATLLQLYHGDVEAVAARLRRTVSWVAARARLTTLSLKWRKAIAGEGNEGFHTWTAAHLAEVAKLAPAAQDELLERFRYDSAGASVKDVRDEIGRAFLSLGLAPFDVEDAALVPKVGACSTCPTTSASAPGLFADEGDEIRPSELRKARCLNPGCWKVKLLAHAKQQVRELRKKHGDAALVAQHRYHAPSDLQGKLREVDSYGSDYVKAKEGAKGAWPGVYVTGEKLGQVEWFTKRAKGSSSSASGAKKGAAGGAEKTVTPLKDRRAALDRRRRVLAVSLVRAAVEKSPSVPSSTELLALALIFGTKNRADFLNDYYMDQRNDGAWSKGDRWKSFDVVVDGLATTRDDAAADKALAALWQKQLRPILLSRLTYQGSSTDIAKLWADACRTAALAGVDAAALLAKAVEEIPEPKSWAALAAKERAARKAAKPTAKRKRPAEGASAATP